MSLKSTLSLILALFLLNFTSQPSYAVMTNEERNLNESIIKCDNTALNSDIVKNQQDLLNNNGVSTTYVSCTSQGIVTTEDPVDAAKIQITLHYDFYQYDPPSTFGTAGYIPYQDQLAIFRQTDLQSNGNSSYSYCSYTDQAQRTLQAINMGNSGQSAYGRVTRITFSADGYTSRSYPIDKNNPCTSGGSPVGGDVLKKETDTDTNTYTCGLDSNNDPVCNSSDNTSSTDLAKCNEGLSEDSQDFCGKTWYVICATGGPGQGITACPVEDRRCDAVSASDSVGTGGGPYATYRACIEGSAGELDVEAPTPTPKPPPPPCKNEIGADGCTEIYSVFGGLSTNPEGFLTRLFAIFLSLSGGIALLLIIRSGYQMMTSQGNAEKVKEAQDRITSAVVGLLFVIFSIVILEVIGVDLLNLPGLGR